MHSLSKLQFGIEAFGDITHADDGTPYTHAHALREVLEQVVFADEVGMDAIGLCEHHRADFAISASDIVLARIAGATRYGACLAVPLTVAYRRGRTWPDAA